MRYIFITLICCISISASAINYSPNDTNKLDASGKKQGLWKEITEGLEWYGMYYNDTKNGVWASYHPATSPPLVNRSIGYINGKRNGLYIETDRNGFITMQEFYKNDSLEGMVVVFASGGKPKSEASFHNGKLNGTKKLYNSENFKLQEEGVYVNGKREGVAKWYYTEGKVSVEYTYKNGDLEGKMKTYYKNGNISAEGTYVHNEFEGDYFEYYENGNVKCSGKYIKGKKEGIWKEYDENEKMKQVKYKNGEVKK